MKILFSPSETKSYIVENGHINVKSFCCQSLFDKRIEVINRYQRILDSKNMENLKKMFGIKDEKKCLELCNIDIKSASTCKSIKRYTGVAYEYLNYQTLSKKKQNYIDENLIIFSNLFGPIQAKDSIPIYKLKQGSSLEGFKTENFYKEFFSEKLDDMLRDEFTIDLRAEFYEKFYKIPYPHITLKFIKNGKVVSHWAKAYRGIILRNLAINNINSLKDFKNMEVENLALEEIIEQRLKTQIIYNIVS
ncbi:MAG: YaaA family protein [Epsilonproteobacteria bacterium]|nr:YaaA family protein [Campylobacterota bacterium]